MSLSLYGGKILAGGAVATVGAGGIVLYVKNPEWFTSSKTSQDEQPTIPGWMTVFNLQEICKDSKTTKDCQLTKEQTEKLGFVLGTGESSEHDSVHLNGLDTFKKVSLQWKEIDEDENNFPFKTLFTIGAGEAALEIQKSGTDATNKISITANSTMQFRLHKKSVGNGHKYYFKQLEQTDKEKNSGMNCGGNNSCSSATTGTNVNGLNGNYTITKTTVEDSEKSKYPDGFKYKVSTNSFTTEDGYYKLIFDEASKKWKLERVEDLFNKWDKSVIETGTWGANAESQESPKSIKVTVSETEQKINGSGEGTAWTWECEIKASTEDQSHTFTLTDQINKLKEQLGIKDPKTPLSEEIKKQRKIFVENCANKRTSEQKGKINDGALKDNKLESTITLSTEGENSSKKFKQEDFDSLFKGKVTNA